MVSQHPRRASLLLNVAKALAVGLVLVVLAGGLALRTPTRAEDPSALRLDAGSTELERAMVEHQCTTTGFGGSVLPRSALIRHQGRLRHVSFDHGWTVFTGKRPGELLAVCLSDR